MLLNNQSPYLRQLENTVMFVDSNSVEYFRLSTKIIVPSELQNLVTLGTTLSESAKTDKTETL